MRHPFFCAVAVIATVSPASAKGPTGFGDLKLGMTKEDIEALADPVPVRPDGPMRLYQYGKNVTPKAGREQFDVALSTPLATSPLEAVLDFEGGRLTSLYLKLTESSNMLERLSRQITEKYGPGKVEDDRKEKQCVYKNGSNFKVTSGMVKTKWVEDIAPNEQVESTLTDISIVICPPSLRYDGVDPIKFLSLTIRRVNPSTDSKPKNLF